MAPTKDFEQGKYDKEVQDKILGGSQDLWLPPKFLRRANEIHFENGQLNTRVQAKFELHGRKIPSILKMPKK